MEQVVKHMSLLYVMTFVTHALVKHKLNVKVVNIIKFLMVIFAQNHVMKLMLIKAAFVDHA